MMPMLIDAGKRLLIDAQFLIDAGERVSRDSVVQDDCVTRDDGFWHALYAVAFDLDEHCGMSLVSNAAKPSPSESSNVTRYAQAFRAARQSGRECRGEVDDADVD
jgi:hypothetical protein